MTKSKRRFWTKEEDALLKEFYPENGVDYCAKLLGRSFYGTKSRAVKLELRSNINWWTEEENNVIRDVYPDWGVVKCQELLPDRAETAIAKQAQNLGVKCDLIVQRQNIGLRSHDMPKGFYIGSHGYWTYSPTGKTGDRILYHRYVMENHLGRRLKEHEIIHHKDEDKLNNHIGNLEIMTRSEHASHHHGNGFNFKVTS